MRTKSLVFKSGILALASCALLTACGGVGSGNAEDPFPAHCPSKEQVLSDLKSAGKNLPPKILNAMKVDSVSYYSKEGLDMCLVKIEINGQKQAVFLTPDGRWVIVGSVIDTKTGENVLAKVNQKFQEEQIKKQENALKSTDLQKYVAYVYYNGKSYYDVSKVPSNTHYIYLITDPKCPFCHETEKPLMEWADKNHVAVRVIVLPLPIHPGSFRTSVGLYCNKKGLHSLYEAYNSNTFLSQCDAGKKYEEDVRKNIMPKIMGTPTFIGENGVVIPGAIVDEKEFDKLINK